MIKKCDYCGEDAALVVGAAVYPHRHDLRDLPFWHCRMCSAWVGCHSGTITPLGRLADAHLRAAKQRAHAAFDPLWKGGRMKRGQAYSWLAGKLNIAKQECHIGMFTEEQCDRVVEVCQQRGGLHGHA